MVQKAKNIKSKTKICYALDKILKRVIIKIELKLNIKMRLNRGILGNIIKSERIRDGGSRTR